MMFVSEKSHQNLSDFIQFLFKRRFELNKKKGIISSEKIINSGHNTYNYNHSFFEKDF